MTFLSRIGLLIALAAGVAWPAAAQDAPGRDWTFNALEENDSFVDGDEHYTQAVYFSLFAAQRSGEDRFFDRLRGIADAIMVLPAEGGRIHFGGFLGQSIFTPEDIRRPEPDPRDRPYAGWLYGGVSLYRDAGRTLDRATLTLGVVGPGAGGRKVQNGWHDLIYPFLGSPQAEGWSSQLENEPGLVLSQERKWRFAGTLGGIEIDAVPEVNVALGNVFTYAGAGGIVRLGRRLRADWGPPRVQPAVSGSDFVDHAVLREGAAWYVFAGGEGRAVARNIFLDGNTWESGPDVDRKPFVADLTAGAAFAVGWARLSASYTLRSEEFEGQQGRDDFLAISLSVLF
jgi:lipid A 3-O-deacylase